MSDITIPGVTSKFDTQTIVAALMEVERLPLKRMEAEVDLRRSERSAWQDLNRPFTTLRDGRRSLYGFQSPFNDHIVGCSDEKSVTATATRTAIDETMAVIVRRVATADRFLSRSLPRDFAVPAGDYGFRVGERVRFAFRGGSSTTSPTPSTAGGHLLQASVVNDTKTPRCSSWKRTRPARTTACPPRQVRGPRGEDRHAGAARTASRALSLTERAVTARGEASSTDPYRLADGVLTLEPAAELKMPVQPGVALNERMVLELSVKVEVLGDDYLPDSRRQAPGPDTGAIEFGGIRIESGRSQAPLPAWEAPKPPAKVTDIQVLYLESAGKLVALPGLPDSGGVPEVTIEVGKLAGSIESLDLRNRNTHRRISITGMALWTRPSAATTSPPGPSPRPPMPRSPSTGSR